MRVRVLIFGDSITQGFWDTEGGWVQRLRTEYDKEFVKGGSYPPTFFNLGISGDKSDSILVRLQTEIEARKYQGEEFVLVFAVGANNSYVKHGKPYSSPEQVENDLIKIVQVARQYSEKIVFVGLTSCDETRSNPVAWDDICYTNDRLQQFDSVIAKVCHDEYSLFIPLFEVFQKEQAKRNLLFDGIHPNNDGHKLIAESVKPELDKLIGWQEN